MRLIHRPCAKFLEERPLAFALENLLLQAPWTRRISSPLLRRLCALILPGVFLSSLQGVEQTLQREGAVAGLRTRVLHSHCRPTGKVLQGHGGRDFVHVLTARPARSGKGFLEICFSNPESAHSSCWRHGRIFVVRSICPTLFPRDIEFPRRLRNSTCYERLATGGGIAAIRDAHSRPIAVYTALFTREAAKVGKRLAREGVIGRFAFDFVVVRCLLFRIVIAKAPECEPALTGSQRGVARCRRQSKGGAACATPP